MQLISQGTKDETVNNNIVNNNNNDKQTKSGCVFPFSKSVNGLKGWCTSQGVCVCAHVRACVWCMCARMWACMQSCIISLLYACMHTCATVSIVCITFPHLHNVTCTVVVPNSNTNYADSQIVIAYQCRDPDSIPWRFPSQPESWMAWQFHCSNSWQVSEWSGQCHTGRTRCSAHPRPAHSARSHQVISIMYSQQMVLLGFFVALQQSCSH